MRSRPRARCATIRRPRDVGVDVIAFCDEEGHFGSYLGSRSFIGDVTEAEIDKARDRTHGQLMREALAGGGLRRPAAADIDPGRYVGYLRSAHRAGPHARNREPEDRRGHRDRRPLGLPHQGDRPAEPRRHHDDGRAQRRRPDAGPAGRGDRPAFKQITGPRTVWTCGRWSSIPASPASSRARRRRCSSSATPTRRCSSGWKPRCTSWSRRPIAPGPCTIAVETSGRARRR